MIPIDPPLREPRESSVPYGFWWATNTSTGEPAEINDHGFYCKTNGETLANPIGFPVEAIAAQLLPWLSNRTKPTEFIFRDLEKQII